MTRNRLDSEIFARGLAESITKAKALVMSGVVYLDGQKAETPGQAVTENMRIEVRENAFPYVSRGGYKLEKALRVFTFSEYGGKRAPSGLICLDVGASTGGFTDCMLQNGAEKVYAVDVAYGQLAWKLRQDPRVVNLERTNFRTITRAQIPEPIRFASVDVSFISLARILPALYPLLAEGGEAVCLVKPQFEAPRALVGKNGVVSDPSVHAGVLEAFCETAALNEFFVHGLTHSPVKGPKGNIEFLAHIRKQTSGAASDIAQVVEQAHRALEE